MGRGRRLRTHALRTRRRGRALDPALEDIGRGADGGGDCSGDEGGEEVSADVVFQTYSGKEVLFRCGVSATRDSASLRAVPT